MRILRRFPIWVALTVLLLLFGAFSRQEHLVSASPPDIPSTPVSKPASSHAQQLIFLPIVACSGCVSDIIVTGKVEWDSGSPVESAQVVARTADGNDTATGTTDVDGTFSLTLTPREPTRVLVEVTVPGPPPVTSGRWSGQVAGGPVDVGTIVLPDPSNAQLSPVGSGSWRNIEGSVIIENAPGNIAQVWAQAYDPGDQAEAFPGAFEDESGQPLNSSVFVWVEAVDTTNQPVDQLSSPATMRVEVPRSQWGDLKDLQPGNGQIDAPIYRYDEDLDTWVRQADGKLVDGQGNTIPESEEANIRGGTFADPVYVEFQADHFSWWNLDYPPECGPADYSDAPDPYPVTKHTNICRAWLGPWVDGEPAPRKPDLDLFDDAVVNPAPLTIGVSNWDWSGPLYLNVLIDHNEDGDWQDNGEWVVQNETVVLPPRDSTLVTTTATWDGRKWMRIMLTGVPVTNAPAGGEFAIGETEDIKALKKESWLVIFGNGSVSGDLSCNNFPIDPCDFLLEVGRTVQLQAVPGSGATFQRWFIYKVEDPLPPLPLSCQEGETSPVCTLTVSGSLYIQAHFSGAQLGIAAVDTKVTNSWNNRTCQNNDWRTDPDNCRLRFPTASRHTVTLTADPLTGSSAQIDIIGAFDSNCSPQPGGSYQCTLTFSASETQPGTIWAVAYSLP